MVSERRQESEYDNLIVAERCYSLIAFYHQEKTMSVPFPFDFFLRLKSRARFYPHTFIFQVDGCGRRISGEIAHRSKI